MAREKKASRCEGSVARTRVHGGVGDAGSSRGRGLDSNTQNQLAPVMPPGCQQRRGQFTRTDFPLAKERT